MAGYLSGEEIADILKENASVCIAIFVEDAAITRGMKAEFIKMDAKGRLHFLTSFGEKLAVSPGEIPFKLLGDMGSEVTAYQISFEKHIVLIEPLAEGQESSQLLM